MNKKVLMGLVLLVIGTSMAFAQADKLSFTGVDNNRAWSVRPANNQISGSVVIPATYNDKPVTHIGGSAFSSSKNITSVTIPNSITTFGALAFSSCSNLTSVTFQGGNMTFSSNYVFDGDLVAKYQAGGAGIYTRPAGSNTWTKQGGTVCPHCGAPEQYWTKRP